MPKAKVKKISQGVWQTLERFPRICFEDLKNYVEAIPDSPMKRARICFHDSTADPMQEMFIVFDGASYVRPSNHVNRDESFHMIDGVGKYVLFGKNGEQVDDVRLGNYESDLPFYCRIPGNLNHSIVLYSRQAIAHEVCTGPFEKSNTEFPPWSVDYQSSDEMDQYRQHHTTQPVAPLLGCQYERLSEEVCRVNPGVVSIKRSDLEYLKSEVYKTTRKRIRLCIHQADSDLLHEMFVAYTGTTYVRAKKQIGKAESFHILEGEADFVFFDDEGNVLDVVHVGSKISNNNFFVRVPAGVFYSMIIRSDLLLVHEAISGSASSNGMLWAAWAPLDSDHQSIEAYSMKLERRVQEFNAPRVGTGR